MRGRVEKTPFKETIMTELADLVIRNGLIVTQDEDRQILFDTDIAVKNGQIVGIGKHLPYQSNHQIDAHQKVVMPGLVDSHMHETLTRGVCEDLPLNRWLDEICFPLDRSHTYDTIYAAALMNQLEMIRGGITTFIDIYRFPEACAEVAMRSGLRGIFVPQIIISPSGVGESIESAERFVQEWKGRSPQITPGFGPHAPYSLSPEDYEKIGKLAEKYDVPIHTHLSETLWEVGLIKDQYGCTATELLYRAGVLTPRLSVAHGVHLTDQDIRLLVDNGVGLAHNPSSNMKMAAGVARIPYYLSAGLKVGLGTDSNLSNNNLDMFEEMRLAAFLQKLQQNDATIMPVQTVLDMATRFSANVLGVDEKVGSLEIGKQADIIILDINQPHFWPINNGSYENIKEQIVYSANAGDVSHTIVAGKVLMADRKVLTLEIDETFSIVQKATTTLMKRAGML
jgi:5-methylthioadenosine/S-adenosylhomocysteine deaminase